MNYPEIPSVKPGQKAITLTMAECHWLRIRASLLSSVNDLASADSPLESQYAHTHKLVKLAIDQYL